MNFIDKLVKKYSSTYVAGALALLVYLIVIGLLYFYFGYTTKTKPQNYVKKNEHKINITLSSPPSDKKIQISKQSEKETTAKKKPLIKEETKEVAKKEVIESKKTPKLMKKTPKKPVSDLFKNVKPTKKRQEKQKEPTKSKEFVKTNKIIQDTKRPSTKASELVKSTLKKTEEGKSGIEKEYFAKIQETLMGWPAQSEFMGFTVRVVLYIEPDGKFKFKIKHLSENEDFNKSLKEYLSQLQVSGFDPHENKKAYEIEVEFIAKQ